MPKLKRSLATRTLISLDIYKLDHFLTNMRKLIKSNHHQQQNSILYQLDNSSGKMISNLYQILKSMESHDSDIKRKWEADLQQEISVETWRDICSESHLVTCSNSWRKFKWKLTARYFRTPHITGKIGSSSSSNCWRKCGETDSKFLHTF